jgi:hypothetical protein
MQPPNPRAAIFLSTTIAAIVVTLPAIQAQSTDPAFPGLVQTTRIPGEFTDPETKLRVVHLSRFPNDYSGVVYFTYNTFSPDSKLALFDTQYKDRWRGLFSFDFTTLQAKPLAKGQLTQG